MFNLHVICGTSSPIPLDKGGKTLVPVAFGLVLVSVQNIIRAKQYIIPSPLALHSIFFIFQK